MADEHKIFKFKTREGTPYQIGDGGAHLRLTDAKIAESLQEQAARALVSPHVSVSPQMVAVYQARRDAVTWLEGLRQVEQELHARHTKAERKTLVQRLNHFAKMLAEALATCGSYEEALMVLPRAEVRLKKEYEAIRRAIEKPDHLRCGKDCAAAFQQNPSLVTRERIHAFVYSKRHGKVMPAVKCGACGDLNVRALDGALARRHAARKQADKLIAGMEPDRARQTLIDAGLTAERIL